MSRYLAAALVVLHVTSGVAGESTATALETFTQLRQKASAAHKSGDRAVYLDAVLQIRSLLNDAPDAVELSGRAYAETGDQSHALDALNLFATLGQADDQLLAGVPGDFNRISKLPEYGRILDRFAHNKKPVTKSVTAFILSDPDLLPEDLDYDPGSKSFLITSVLKNKIVRLAPSGKMTDFAYSPSHWPILAIKVDVHHGRVWATEVAIDGFKVAPKADWGRSAVLCFALSSGALLRRMEGPAHSALGDMVLDAEGFPIVTDGDRGGVYRVSGDRLTVLNDRDFISPQTPAMLPDGRHLLVPDYARGIGLLRIDSGHVTWLNAQAGAKTALNGVDGLYFDRGSLILTQNGTAPERVVRVSLDETYTRTGSEEVIEKATETLGDPTHGAIVDDVFFYIANSGWNVLDEHANVRQGKVPTPARIMRFRLR